MAQVKCGDTQAKARPGGLRNQRGTQMVDRVVTEGTAGSSGLVEAELVGRDDSPRHILQILLVGCLFLLPAVIFLSCVEKDLCGERSWFLTVRVWLHWASEV